MSVFHDEYGFAYEIEDSPAPLARECVWCEPRHLISPGTLPATSGMCEIARSRFEAQIDERSDRGDGLVTTGDQGVPGGREVAPVGDPLRLAGLIGHAISEAVFGKRQGRLDVPPVGHRR